MLFTGIEEKLYYLFSGLLILNQLTLGLLCYTLTWIRLFTIILYYFLQYQQAEHSVSSQSFLWFIISINWPDASFLQMIAGGAPKCLILTFCFVIKKSEHIQWQ